MRLRSLLACVVFGMMAAGGFAAPQQWVRVTSPHFTVLTDSSEKQGRHILDQFERLRWVFQTIFPKFNVDPPEPILILAAKNDKTFQALEPSSYLARGQLKLAGLFLQVPDRNYILLRLDAEDEQHPYATIYHEYTHLQFRNYHEWLPLWANEGFAEFVQNTEIREKNVHLGMASADDILYLRDNRLIPLDVLFRVDEHSPYYHEEQKGSVFYAQSWALVHFLEITDSQNHTHRLQDYLDLCRNREDPVVAGEKAFGDLKGLQEQLHSYIGSSRYMEFVLNSAAAPIDESGYTAQPLTDTQADAARAGFLAGVQRNSEARALAEKVLASDSQNVPAREVLGALAFQANDHPSARKWYGEAVNLGSDNYLAYFYFARLSLERSPDADPDIVEKSLRSAIRLNPHFAPSYDDLALLLAMHHKDLDEAHRLNVQAIQLDPTQLGYRMNASSILMEQGNFESAASVLRAAQKLAKAPSEQKMIEDHLAQIQQIVDAQARQQASAHGSSRDSANGFQPSEPHIDVAVSTLPSHPDAAAKAPHHTVQGVIHEVKCGYPSVLEFQLAGIKKTVTLFNNNFFKIDLAVLGFTPRGTIDPCHDFDGMKAKIEYADAPDKSVDGQVLSVVLMK